MCSHYDPQTDPARLRTYFGVDDLPLGLKTSLWPGYHGPFVRKHEFADVGDDAVPLISSMELAKKGSRSQEILSAIATLEQLLSESDECQHTVMAVQAVPAGIALEFALDCVRECIDVTPAEIRLSASGELVLTITGRGDYGHVQLMAKSILSCGINRARAAIWVSEIR